MTGEQQDNLLRRSMPDEPMWDAQRKEPVFDGRGYTTIKTILGNFTSQDLNTSSAQLLRGFVVSANLRNSLQNFHDVAQIKYNILARKLP